MVALVGALLLGLCAYFYRKKVFVSFLFAIYAFSFLCAFFLKIFGFYGTVVLEWFPLLYLLIVFGVVFPSFSTVSERVDVDISGKLKIIADVFLLFGLLSVVFYGYHSFCVLTKTDVANFRLQDGGYVKSSIFNTIFSVISTLYFVPMLLFFLLVKKNIYKLYRRFLLLSTISFPLLCLSYAGRDGLIFWCLNFIVLFLFFQDDLPFNYKKRILNILKLSFVFVTVTLFFITVKRFGYGKDAFISLLDYAGQQFVHFSNTFYCNVDLFGVNSHVFPGWEGIMNRFFNSERLSGHTGTPIIVSGVNEYNVFSFFVSSFTRDFGKVIGFFVLFCFAFIARYYSNKFNERGSCLDLIIMFTLFQIPMDGLFYYRQGVGNGDVIYILFVCFVSILKRLKIRFAI